MAESKIVQKTWPSEPTLRFWFSVHGLEGLVGWLKEIARTTPAMESIRVLHQHLRLLCSTLLTAGHAALVLQCFVRTIPAEPRCEWANLFVNRPSDVLCRACWADLESHNFLENNWVLMIKGLYIQFASLLYISRRLLISKGFTYRSECIAKFGVRIIWFLAWFTPKTSTMALT
jgi:hypothetical protein